MLFIQCNGSIGTPRASAGQNNISFVARALFVVCESPVLFGENRAKLAHLLLFRAKSTSSTSTKLNGRFSPENQAFPPRFQVAARSARGRSSVPGMLNRIGAAAFEVPKRHLHAAQLLFGKCSVDHLAGTHLQWQRHGP